MSFVTSTLGIDQLVKEEFSELWTLSEYGWVGESRPEIGYIISCGYTHFVPGEKRIKVITKSL
jgi:hypothetical protein